jgi:adenosylmethionine---8-amino-7-oxononanoate aminotransferase
MPNKNNASWSERDALVNWHPYTQHKTSQLPIAIVKADNALLWDENGKEYIDAIASWWANPYGHCNKTIAQAITNQMQTLEHVLFGGFTHPTAVQLSEKLLGLLPNNQKRVFFSDNGSTAVEVALKAALQYFFNKGKKKYRVIAFEDAFHGDTFGAMAASGISIFTEAFKGQLLDVIRVDLPTQSNIENLKSRFLEEFAKDDVAAFLFEPLVQGAAGMRMYDAKLLDELIAICKQHQVFCIADEVMTGFGRTGSYFASLQLKQSPDMICLSKALTAGFVPMAVTSFSEEIYQGFVSDTVEAAFFHGHTFTANPIGCAAALAGITLLESEEMQTQIQRVHEHHLYFKSKIQNHTKCENVRVLGCIFALDVKVDEKQAYYGQLRNKLYAFFIENGVLLRPVANTIYILPPYTITDEQLSKVYQTVEMALEIA